VQVVTLLERLTETVTCSWAASPVAENALLARPAGLQPAAPSLARRELSWVTTAGPREVNLQKFQQEREFWREWNPEFDLFRYFFRGCIKTPSAYAGAPSTPTQSTSHYGVLRG
jgi:hypothetical protein